MSAGPYLCQGAQDLEVVGFDLDGAAAGAKGRALGPFCLANVLHEDQIFSLPLSLNEKHDCKRAYHMTAGFVLPTAQALAYQCSSGIIHEISYCVAQDVQAQVEQRQRYRMQGVIYHNVWVDGAHDAGQSGLALGAGRQTGVAARVRGRAEPCAAVWGLEGRCMGWQQGELLRAAVLLACRTQRTSRTCFHLAYLI